MNWQKFLDLIKKTGDRLIVVDKEEGEAFVVMSLSEYENLVSKNSGQRVSVKSAGAQVPSESMVKNETIEPEPGFQGTKISEEERFYLEPIE